MPRRLGGAILLALLASVLGWGLSTSPAGPCAGEGVMAGAGTETLPGYDLAASAHAAVGARLGPLLGGCRAGAAPLSVAPAPPTWSLRDRAAPLCDAALSGPPPAGSGTVRPPLLALWQSDHSGLEPQYRSRAAEPRGPWNQDAAQGSLSLLAADLRADESTEVAGIVCLRQLLIQTGRSAGTAQVGGRKDWDVRLLRWPDGAVVAGRLFHGADPPSGPDRDVPPGCIEGCLTHVHFGASPERQFAEWLGMQVTPLPRS